MKMRSLYIIMAAMMAGACTTTEQTFVTPEFENSHLSGEIRNPFYKTHYLPAFMGYQTYIDTVLKDQTVTRYSPHSVLSPDTLYMESVKEMLMEFGNDSLRTVIRYHTALSYRDATGHGFVFDVLSKDRSQDVYSSLIANLDGTICCPVCRDSARFAFHESRGYFLLGEDSFRVAAQYDKPGKLMRTLIGLQLMKGDAVYGVLNTFTGVLPHKVYIYSKASEREQLFMAAYFAVVARYVSGW